ncbi:MAG: 4Fe-4S binding protein [Oscillospiraceae bacterium]|nr:4Fe-4S binding protein [Oscillospiraceae bacterium]
MAKVFLIDVARCSGCYNCQLACKDEHCGNDWRPYAAPQTPTGQFWCRVQEHVCGTIPKVRIHYIPGMCNHCEKAACMEVCPEHAISRRPDGLILIDPDRCSGCGKCQEACYYDDVIYLNRETGIAQKCTGCAHLLDHGDKQPRCVDACPTDAMQWVEESLVGDARPAKEGIGAKVYYKNIPGKFIGGTVYDPVEKEVIIGGKCVLTNGVESWTTETDSYGDFWFKNLKVGTYSLTISCEGFADLHFEGLSTEKDLNLDDLPMTRV